MYIYMYTYIYIYIYSMHEHIMHMMCRHNVHTHHKPDIEQPMMCMYKYIVCECVHTV